MNILDIALKLNVSSQLNTNTNLPKVLPNILTDSVLPVPAGPKGAPPILSHNAYVNVK